MKNEKINMKCPDCGNDLHEVTADIKHGVKIKLDQCSRCGGIWFDDFELYPIPKEEIGRIENIDLEKLQENVFWGEGKKNCPRCDVKLDEFKDYNFPKQLEAEFCPKCGGIWMNRGESVEFKKWQEEKRKSSGDISEKDEEFQGKIKDMLEQYRDKDIEKIGNIGKFLSLKIDPLTNRPLNQGDFGSDGYNKASETVSTAMNIIYLLLRLFLKM